MESGATGAGVFGGFGFSVAAHAEQGMRGMS